MKIYDTKELARTAAEKKAVDSLGKNHRVWPLQVTDGCITVFTVHHNTDKMESFYFRFDEIKAGGE